MENQQEQHQLLQLEDNLHTPILYGEDPMALSSGTFTYTVTDANSVHIQGHYTYDPQNNLAILTSYLVVVLVKMMGQLA